MLARLPCQVQRQSDEPALDHRLRHWFVPVNRLAVQGEQQFDVQTNQNQPNLAHFVLLGKPKDRHKKRVLVRYREPERPRGRADIGVAKAIMIPIVELSKKLNGWRFSNPRVLLDS